MSQPLFSHCARARSHHPHSTPITTVDVIPVSQVSALTAMLCPQVLLFYGTTHYSLSFYTCQTSLFIYIKNNYLSGWIITTLVLDSLSLEDDICSSLTPAYSTLPCAPPTLSPLQILPLVLLATPPPRDQLSSLSSQEQCNSEMQRHLSKVTQLGSASINS